jgi:hypothetical protein
MPQSERLHTLLAPKPYPRNSDKDNRMLPVQCKKGHRNGKDGKVRNNRWEEFIIEVIRSNVGSEIFRTLVKTIVATLSIKRVSHPEIINEIYRQTHKMISRQSLYDIKQIIKKDSYHWYRTMREGQYEYIHEFKERIDEVRILRWLTFVVLSVQSGVSYFLT